MKLLCPACGETMTTEEVGYSDGWAVVCCSAKNKTFKWTNSAVFNERIKKMEEEVFDQIIAEMEAEMTAKPDEL